MGKKAAKRKRAKAASNAGAAPPAAPAAEGSPAAAAPGTGQDDLTDEEFARYMAEQEGGGTAAPAPPAPPAPPVAAAPPAPPAPPAPAAAAPPAPPTPPVAAAPPAPPAPRPAAPRPAAPRPAAPRPPAAAAPAPPAPPAAPAAPAPPVATAPAPVAPAAPAPPVTTAPAPVAPAAPVAQPPAVQPKAALAVPIERIFQPDNEQMTIVDAEYPILTPGQNTSLALEMAQASMFDLSAWDLPKIKWPTQGNVLWQYMTAEGPKSAEWLTGILVYFKEGYDFWSRAFGDEETGPPDCSSNDGAFGVGDPGGSCKQCPWFQWGSGRQINPQAGEKSKACRHSTRMFLVQHGSTMPTLIVAPPTSVKALRRYSLGLAGSNLFYFGVETHLGLTPKQSGNFTVGELNPQRGRVLNNDQVKEAYRMMAAFKGMYEGNPRAAQQDAGTF